jgi:hypothetical protein
MLGSLCGATDSESLASDLSSIPHALPLLGAQFLNWKFGSSLEEEALQVGFCMQFMPEADVTNLQWVYEGEDDVPCLVPSDVLPIIILCFSDRPNFCFPNLPNCWSAP